MSPLRSATALHITAGPAKDVRGLLRRLTPDTPFFNDIPAPGRSGARNDACLSVIAVTRVLPSLRAKRGNLVPATDSVLAMSYPAIRGIAGSETAADVFEGLFVDPKNAPRGRVHVSGPPAAPGPHSAQRLGVR